MSRDVCGTYNGYRVHLLLKEETCAACKEANNAHGMHFKVKRVLRDRKGTAWTWYSRGYSDAIEACVAAVQEALGANSPSGGVAIDAMREVKP